MKKIIFLLVLPVLCGCGDAGTFEKNWHRWMQVRRAASQEIAAGQVRSGEYLLALANGEMEQNLSKARVAELLDKDMDSIKLLGQVFDPEAGSRQQVVSLKGVTSEDLHRWDILALLSYAEPNWLSQQHERGDYEGFKLAHETSLISDDFPYLGMISLEEAFVSLGDTPINEEGPIIAILDSGVDVKHPALQGKFYENPAFQSDTKCPGDLQGCDATKGDRENFGHGVGVPFSLQAFGQACRWNSDRSNCQHGTIIAGMIAADPTPGSLIAPGICPGCRILPVKVVEESGRGRGQVADESIMNALGYLIELKRKGVPIKVVNASYGKYRMSRTVSLKIKELVELGDGVIFVAAAGNENSSKPQFPAALDSVLGVANIQPSGAGFSGNARRHKTSNYGAWVSIAAPGSDICSTVPGGGSNCGGRYKGSGEVSGTSFSAPVVAAVAGLVYQRQPGFTAKQVRSVILESVIPIKRGKLELMGRVDAARAVGGLVIPNLESESKRIKRGCAVLGDARFSHIGWLLLLLPLMVPARVRSSRDI